MTRGVVLGLVYQALVAVGFTIIARVTLIKNDPAGDGLLKSMLMLVVGGAGAACVIVYLLFARRVQAAEIRPSDWLALTVGSLLVLVIGESLYIWGLAAVDGYVPPIALTALAFPAAALLIDWVLRLFDRAQGKSSPPTLMTPNPSNLIGLALVVAGFILILIDQSKQMKP